MSMLSLRASVMRDMPHEETITGNPAVFRPNFASKLRGLTIPFAPMQSGSGDPSPSNVRPISGFTGVNVWRTGKNLFDKNNKTVLNAYVDSTEIVVSTASRTICIPCKPNTQYTISKTASKRFTIGYINNETPAVGNAVYGYSVDHSATSMAITTGDGAKWLVLWIYTSQYDTLTLDEICDTLQVEVGSTATNYESYSGIQYPIDWTDEAGTVYGGYVDLVTGEVWKAWHSVTIDGTNITGRVVSSTYINETTTRAYYTVGNSTLKPSSDNANVSKCNTAVYRPLVSENNIQCYKVGQDGANVEINVRLLNTLTGITSGDTANEAQIKWNAYAAEHPIQVLFEYDTPTLLATLTPTEIQTLIGTNTIWSDTNGTNTIKYFKKG